MRTIFLATGDIAIPSFRILLAKSPRPLALVTQPDRPVGRHQIPTPPAIKLEAIAAGIPVFQPERVGDATAELEALEPELIVVMAYGQILRKPTLRLASRAIINLHASLLPKYRGAACIQAAIDAGDVETGVTSMHVVRELDAGDIILSKSTPIAPNETGGSLHDRLAGIAADVLEETLVLLEHSNAPRRPQDPSAASYVSKLERGDGKLDWSMASAAIERRIRAYDPWPGTFAEWNDHGAIRRIKIFPHTKCVDAGLKRGEVVQTDGRLLVGCGDGALELFHVQPEGGRRMTAADFMRGRCPHEFL